MSSQVNILRREVYRKRRDGEIALAPVANYLGSISPFSYDAAQLLLGLLDVDGAGSGLDADLLDGQHGSYYAPIDSPVFTTQISVEGAIVLSGNINGAGGGVNMDINPDVALRLGRSTDNVGFAVHVYRGDNTANINHSLKGIGDSYVCYNNGNFAIGFNSGSSKLSINGGVHIGGISDAGDNNLIVDGTCDITGISTFTGLVKTVGGVHIGGTSDPGVDNLIVDGTSLLSGVATFANTTNSAITIHGGVLKNDYASQLTGYRISASGEADFRYIYADELHVKSFIADLEQALAGGQIVAKSVAKIATDFTIPAAGAAQTLVVEEFAGYTGAVFADGDMIRLRQFSRANNTTLDIADVWGTVVYVSRNGSANPSTQSFTFTRSTAPNAGSGSGTIKTGTLALDYGTSGTGYYEVTAVDGVNGANSPYSQVVTWTGHPATGSVLKYRAGNLSGITDADFGGALSGFGIYGDNAYLKGSIIATAGLIGGFTINATEGLYSGTGATRVQMKVGVGIWCGAAAIGDAPFSVTNAGVIKAISGTIGGWTLSATSLSTGAFDTAGTMYFGTSGLSLSDKFKVTSTGALTALGVAEIGTNTGAYTGGNWNVGIKEADIFEASGLNYSVLHLNRLSYHGGVGYFRDLVVGDGKGNTSLFLSQNALTFYIGDVSSATEYNLRVTGNCVFDHDVDADSVHCGHLHSDGGIDFSTSPTIDFGSNHVTVTGTSDITCGASEGDMTSMSTSFTPKGDKILITFCASFYVSSANQTMWLIINVGGTNVRTMRSYIIGGYQPHAITYIADVTPNSAVTVKMRWSGGTAIQQRGSTDGYRVMTITDIY